MAKARRERFETSLTEAAAPAARPQFAGDGGAAAGATFRARPDGDGCRSRSPVWPRCMRTAICTRRRIAWRFLRYPSVQDQSPITWRGPLPGTINLTSGRRSERLHQYPACGGRGSEGATPFLFTVLLSGHGLVRLARLDRSGL